MPFLFLLIGFGVGGVAAAVRPKETAIALDMLRRTALDKVLMAAALPLLPVSVRMPIKVLGA